MPRVLFGDTPQETLERGREARASGFRAVKFGWGPFGRWRAGDDADHFAAAREGLGPDGILLIDAGQIFGEDVERGGARASPALEQARATWLRGAVPRQRPTTPMASSRRAAPTVKLAGGEGAHNVYMARHLIDFGRVGYVQIDCGRIGGIGPAKQSPTTPPHAASPTSTTPSRRTSRCRASLQPFAGLEDHRICEYPVAPKQLAVDLTSNHITPDANGEVRAPDAPGLGIEVNPAALRRYRVDVEIRVGGRTIYETPRA